MVNIKISGPQGMFYSFSHLWKLCKILFEIKLAVSYHLIPVSWSAPTHNLFNNSVARMLLKGQNCLGENMDVVIM